MRVYPSFPIVIPLLKGDSYALLTRPPLKFLLLKISVRLACVKHTASVHPEPGSNSQKTQRFKETQLAKASLHSYSTGSSENVALDSCPPI